MEPNPQIPATCPANFYHWSLQSTAIINKSLANNFKMQMDGW